MSNGKSLVCGTTRIWKFERVGFEQTQMEKLSNRQDQSLIYDSFP